MPTNINKIGAIAKVRILMTLKIISNEMPTLLLILC